MRDTYVEVWVGIDVSGSTWPSQRRPVDRIAAQGQTPEARYEISWSSASKVPGARFAVEEYRGSRMGAVARAQLLSSWEPERYLRSSMR